MPEINFERLIFRQTQMIINSANSGSRISRRDAIKRTVVFSTGLLGAGLLNTLQAKPPVTKFSGKGIHLLALGDFGTGDRNQIAVSKQMAEFSKKLDAPLTSVLALGDNFYTKLTP